MQLNGQMVCITGFAPGPPVNRTQASVFLSLSLSLSLQVSPSLESQLGNAQRLADLEGSSKDESNDGYEMMRRAQEEERGAGSTLPLSTQARITRLRLRLRERKEMQAKNHSPQATKELWPLSLSPLSPSFVLFSPTRHMESIVVLLTHRQQHLHKLSLAQ